jgi:hypothetical protein
MHDRARSLELYVLRPLWIATLAVAALLAICGLWLWLIAPVVGLLYLGVIGSKLHPLQSAQELSQGPLEGPAARVEQAAPSADVGNLLVGHACTRVGILVGCAIGLAAWATLGWRWYAAAVLGFFAVAIVGGTLKVVFGNAPTAA